MEDEFDSLDYQISEFQSSTVEYIAGYIKLRLPSKLTCKFCVEIVTMDPPKLTQRGLTSMKDRGGLKYASEDLIKICLISEAKIQQAKSNEELFCNRQILNILCLKAVGTCLTQHPHLVEKANHEKFHTYNLIKYISTNSSRRFHRFILS